MISEKIRICPRCDKALGKRSFCDCSLQDFLAKLEYEKNEDEATYEQPEIVVA